MMDFNQRVMEKFANFKERRAIFIYMQWSYSVKHPMSGFLMRSEADDRHLISDGELPTTDRDRAAAERDSLPLISGSPVFNTAACHSVSTSRVAEQIKSHLRAWTGTIRRCVKLPDSKLNYFRRKYRAAPNILHSAVFWPQTPDGTIFPIRILSVFSYVNLRNLIHSPRPASFSSHVGFICLFGTTTKLPNYKWRQRDETLEESYCMPEQVTEHFELVGIDLVGEQCTNNGSVHQFTEWLEVHPQDKELTVTQAWSNVRPSYDVFVKAATKPFPRNFEFKELRASTKLNSSTTVVELRGTIFIDSNQ
ncbi:hypothetical protein EYF80_031124 [Liparis tanakae]|uniref:Uncharacterized protein n=1 Tax=Liparis tanakae TaxID=230148 RepID=A0A4Z2GZ88_9TELE|nr:hypothetical protein EYF80_031124 [Liparis tanakae]